jgi:hypothetical protein
MYANIADKRANDARYRREHLEELRRKRAERYRNNIETARLAWKCWREKNKDHERERGRNRDKSKQREYVKTCGLKARSELREWYVRSKIINGGILHAEDIPKELVELKRAQMKVRRLCRELKTSAS